MAEAKKPAGGEDAKARTGALITIVLDKSGSMTPLAEATIAGFNHFKAEQMEVGADASVSLTLFDTEVNEVCSAIPLRELPDLDATVYQPDGYTALYDAVGSAIGRTRALIEAAAAKPERVLVAIITDGEENASSEFGRRQVFDMIRERQADGWVFVFMGANMDSYAAGEAVGVTGVARARDWTADAVGMRASMAALSRATTRYRGEDAGVACLCDRPFFAPEDEEGGDSAGAAGA